MNTRVYFYKKNISQLESDSARNNIHPNKGRNQRLQIKTPEKEHVNMASQAECESCFQANVLIFTFIFRCSG